MQPRPIAETDKPERAKARCAISDELIATSAKKRKSRWLDLRRKGRGSSSHLAFENQVGGVKNPKPETRNPKECPKPETQRKGAASVSGLGFWAFIQVSGFGFLVFARGGLLPRLP